MKHIVSPGFCIIHFALLSVLQCLLLCLAVFSPTYLNNLVCKKTCQYVTEQSVHHFVPPNTKPKPQCPSHWTDTITALVQHTLEGCSSILMKIGIQVMECEHSGPNDPFQDTQKCHGGAGNQACGCPWFRAERSTGILVRAVSSAPGSTKESPGPGSSSPRWQGGTTLCFILLQDAMSSQDLVLSHKENQKEEVCLLGSSAGVAL